jgi:hypothetical protein
MRRKTRMPNGRRPSQRWLGPAFGIGIPMDSWCDVAFREFVQADGLERYLDGLENV